MDKAVFLSIFIISISLYSPIYANVYESDLVEKINRATNFLNEGQLLRGIHLHTKIAKDMDYPDSIRFKSWILVASIQANQLKNFKKAIGVYDLVRQDFPNLINQDINRRRMELIETVNKYKDANNMLKKINYQNRLDSTYVYREIKILKSILHEYPDYYKKSYVWALLGNRHLFLANWVKAYYYCYKAKQTNSYLRDYTQLFTDYKKAKFGFLKVWLLKWAWLYIVGSLVIIILFRKKIEIVKNLRLLSSLAGVWIIISCILYLTYYWSETPIPQSKNEQFNSPIISVISIQPFASKVFWWFIFYTTFSFPFWFFTNLIIYHRFKGWTAKIFSSFNGIGITTAFLTLFFFFHLGSGFYENNFFYFKEEIENYVPKHPDFFEKYPEILK